MKSQFYKDEKLKSGIIGTPDLIQLRSPQSPKILLEVIVGKEFTLCAPFFSCDVNGKLHAHYTPVTDC